MALTLKFIAEKFKEINERHFDGKLMTPRFEITHVKSYLGQYHWRYSRDGMTLLESVIRVSDMYDRSDDDIANTVAHEMIHLYIKQNRLKDTSTHHGRIFYSVAERLNREGGFHISRTDSVKGCGLRDKSAAKTYTVACFKTKGHGRTEEGRIGDSFIFVMNPNRVEYYKGRFERNPSWFKDVVIFTSTDDKTYARYRECRSGVSGYYLTDKERKQRIEAGKVIYASKGKGADAA